MLPGPSYHDPRRAATWNPHCILSFEGVPCTPSNAKHCRDLVLGPRCFALLRPQKTSRAMQSIAGIKSPKSLRDFRGRSDFEDLVPEMLRISRGKAKQSVRGSRAPSTPTPSILGVGVSRGYPSILRRSANELWRIAQDRGESFDRLRMVRRVVSEVEPRVQRVEPRRHAGYMRPMMFTCILGRIEDHGPHRLPPLYRRLSTVRDDRTVCTLRPMLDASPPMVRIGHQSLER